MEIIFTVIILLFSVIIHELAHGYMALYLGDPTARLAGRLTLNPIKHLDPIGSVLVPIISSLAGFTFGWAKPVPYNPYNLKNKRSGEALVAFAGPLSNIILAIIFAVFIRLIVSMPETFSYFANESFLQIVSYIVIINIMLAIFNLIPVPPLDGSKLVFAILPDQYGRLRMTLEQFGPILFIVVVFFLWQFIAKIVPVLFKLLIGV